MRKFTEGDAVECPNMLDRYIYEDMNEVREVIEANHAVLPLLESIQVFTRLDADTGLAQTIPTALARNIDAVSGRTSG